MLQFRLAVTLVWFWLPSHALINTDYVHSPLFIWFLAVTDMNCRWIHKWSKRFIKPLLTTFIKRSLHCIFGHSDIHVQRRQYFRNTDTKNWNDWNNKFEDKNAFYSLIVVSVGLVVCWPKIVFVSVALFLRFGQPIHLEWSSRTQMYKGLFLI